MLTWISALVGATPAPLSYRGVMTDVVGGRESFEDRGGLEPNRDQRGRDVGVVDESRQARPRSSVIGSLVARAFARVRTGWREMTMPSGSGRRPRSFRPTSFLGIRPSAA